MAEKSAKKSQKLDIWAPNVRKILRLAYHFAVLEGTKQVALRHLLAALVSVKTAASYKAVVEILKLRPAIIRKNLLKVNVSEDDIEALVNKEPKGDLPLHSSVREVLLEALKLSKRVGAYYVGSEHILLSALTFISKHHSLYPRAYHIFRLDEIVLEEFGFNLLQRSLTPFRMLEQQMQEKKSGAVDRPINADMGEDLSEEAMFRLFTKDVAVEAQSFAGDLLLSRKEYVDKILTALQGQLTKNVLLVGESGVGKTYLVYDLAMRISSKKVPLHFQNKKILRISLPEIVATSRFPLDIEKRIMVIFNMVYGKEDIILFIDNIHHLFNPAPKGGINLYSLLLPILESRKVQIIGTMPQEEFRMISDMAVGFKRIFNVIEVDEPSYDETIKILLLHLRRWERFVKINIDYPVLEELVKLTDKYIVDAVLPHKAVSVLDAVVSYELLQRTQPDAREYDISMQLNNIEHMKDAYLEIGDIAQLESLEKETKRLRSKLDKFHKQRESVLQEGIKITLEKIRSYLSELTGLPLYIVDTQERTNLLRIEEELKRYIVAQDEAIEKVAYAIKRGRLGIRKDDRPWASFLFLGPTGVGKSELAKVLARYLFGDDKQRLIQIDMSEFMESHSVSRLIGSPPGYVGYEQGGYLTERVKENPYSVVLFDEIEKAADNVLNILLQILEDGHLTDSKGETVSFKNTIIILTSNIGAEEIFKDRVLGFYRESETEEEVSQAYESMKEILLKQLYKKLRPELINRLDDIIIFRTLTKDDARLILDILLRELNERLEENRIRVKLTPRAKDYLVNKGFSKEFGARALRRVIQQYVENTVADYILAKRWKIKPITDLMRELTLDLDKKTKTLQVSNVKRK